jgi:prevent-host-death family protein
MESIGAYEAKTHFSELLQRVQRGERIYITHHGVLVAALVPLDSKPTRPIREVIATLKDFRRGRSLDVPIRDLINDGRA